MNLPIELKTRIYNHIGEVQKFLWELPADEQREILQSIETHIHDALEKRSNGESSLEQLEAILAEMDPPESYGTTPHEKPSATQAPEQPKARKSTGKNLAFWYYKFALVFVVVMTYLAFDYLKENKKPDTSPAPYTGEATLVGKWASIDFVTNIEEFDPSLTNSTEELYLKGITFLPNGKTTKPWWTWKNNLLIHHGDKSAAEFIIKTINGVDYLFLEWMSGDVLIRGLPPKYYVLKRGEYIETSMSATIFEGIGCGAFKVGASKDELIAALGIPDEDSNEQKLIWRKKKIDCWFGDAHGARELHFNRGFKGITSKGIKMGSRESALLEAYGEPDEVSDKGGPAKRMHWPDQGVLVWLTPEHGVHQIVIFKP